VQADEDLFPRNAKPQVIGSCKLGRKQIGEPKIIDGKLTIVFEEMSQRYQLTYDNNQPELGLAVSKMN
jgi:hypothetical protein